MLLILLLLLLLLLLVAVIILVIVVNNAWNPRVQHDHLPVSCHFSHHTPRTVFSLRQALKQGQIG
jgi:hypothetical protein